MARKFRCKPDLYDFFNDELAWRRKEIIEIKSILQTNNTRVAAKATILIAYSHWEGFVKSTTSAYWEYLKLKAFPKAALSYNTLASLILHNGGHSALRDKLLELRRIISETDYKIKFNIERLVDTNSNLNSDVLETIMLNLGGDSSLFETKRLFIDAVLLKNRNGLAHGEQRYIENEKADEIASQAIELIDLYKNILDNIVTTDSYKMQRLNFGA